MVWWLWCCPFKRVSHSPDSALCDSVTESAMSWYKRRQGSSDDVCVGTVFLLVQLSCGCTLFYGCSSCQAITFLALTSQQTLCTVQQGGSVDLASEWQLKHLCLQTGRRLTESFYWNHWTRSRFNQKNRDPPSAETKSYPVSESDATSLPSFSFVLHE